MNGCRRWFALAMVLIGMTAGLCCARTASLPFDPAACLASGVVSTPLIVGSLTFQVISRPESLRLGVPEPLRAWAGSDASLVCGRLSPRELLVVDNGSWSVTPLDPPARGVVDTLRDAVQGLAGVGGFPADRADPRETLASLSHVLRSEASALVEERLGPVSRRRLVGWGLVGVVLGFLVTSLWASGLVWRSALVLAARPWTSLVTGVAAGLAGILVIGLFVRSRIGIPFLLFPLLASAPLVFILPTVAAGALVVRLFRPQSLLGGLTGLAVVLPWFFLPVLAGPRGIVILLPLALWAFGGVLLSRLPGTGHPYDMKEAPHDQEHLDPAAGRPLADSRSLCPGSDGELRPAADAGQPRSDPVPEPRGQHGPGNPGHGG